MLTSVRRRNQRAALSFSCLHPVGKIMRKEFCKQSSNRNANKLGTERGRKTNLWQSAHNCDQLPTDTQSLGNDLVIPGQANKTKKMRVANSGQTSLTPPLENLQTKNQIISIEDKTFNKPLAETAFAQRGSSPQTVFLISVCPCHIFAPQIAGLSGGDRIRRSCINKKQE